MAGSHTLHTRARTHAREPTPTRDCRHPRSSNIKAAASSARRPSVSGTRVSHTSERSGEIPTTCRAAAGLEAVDGSAVTVVYSPVSQVPPLSSPLLSCCCSLLLAPQQNEPPLRPGRVSMAVRASGAERSGASQQDAVEQMSGDRLLAQAAAPNSLLRLSPRRRCASKHTCSLKLRLRTSYDGEAARFMSPRASSAA